MKHTDDVALPVLDYAYVHESTQSTTGYFSCVPPESLDFDAALERLEAAPMDEFLHLHLLRVLASQGQELACRLTEKCYDKEHDLFTRPAMAALLLENALLAEDGVSIAKAAERAGLPVDAASRLATYSPTIHLRACLSPNHVLSAGWSALFRENICGHHALPVPEDIDMPPIFDRSALEEATHFLRAQTGVMARCHAVMSADAGPAIPRQPAQHTFLRALDALMENGFLDGPEMRHEASLSPIALLRDWKVDVQVDNGRLRHTLRGKATA
ncbi:MAG: bacteriocin, partial [Desulfovibrio sp.]|nr:bacteriocin [Desulfovibrio sp.]